VEVEVNPEPIFPAPLNRLEEVGPRYPFEVWLSRPGLDRPVRQRDANPIETRRSDIGDIFLRDEGLVVFGQSGGEIRAHVLREGVLVNGSLVVRAVGVFFVQCGDDEGFCESQEGLPLEAGDIPVFNQPPRLTP